MKFRNLLISSTLVLSLAACQDEKIQDQTFDVPTTYNFSPADYSGQKNRIAMLSEMVDYIKTASKGAQLDAQKLSNMFTNQNAAFANDTLNTSGKQIKDKVNFGAQNYFQALLDSAAQASASFMPASEGSAGISISKNDTTKKYLVNANGQEYVQIFEKGLMGALLYYQIADVYLSDAKIGSSVDNETVIAGQGTAMQHHWDEAFGYYGVPVDFPTNVTGLKYLGHYSNLRNGVLNINAEIMNAYLLGRAAIGAKDNAKKNEAAAILKDKIQLILASSAIHYMNESVSSVDDKAVLFHALSEGYGFILGLKYSANAKISPAQVDELLALIGENFYQVDINNLKTVKDKLAQYYSLENVKDVL
jgi:hypothetical protein